ncbi:MAG: RlmE family RNA methyltransferase [Desulfobacteraceae bacterium]|nr:RlmE family RNA methyltransferase [Desulfobacteraceae bacterium]
MRNLRSKHNRWEDHYSRLAKKEQFLARSVYKLREIQRKYNLIKKGDKILDLGCFPGSWLLFAADLAGKNGRVVGIDLKPLSKSVLPKVPSNVRIYTGDVLDLDDELIKSVGKDFNIVMSDMAPDTTGNKNVDAARSFNLCQAALRIAEDLLVDGGSFICKIFQGEDFKEFIDSVKLSFNKHKIFKPQSSRKSSKEIYIVGFEKNRRRICRGIANGLQ